MKLYLTIDRFLSAKREAEVLKNLVRELRNVEDFKSCVDKHTFIGMLIQSFKSNLNELSVERERYPVELNEKKEIFSQLESLLDDIKDTLRQKIFYGAGVATLTDSIILSVCCYALRHKMEDEILSVLSLRTKTVVTEGMKQLSETVGCDVSLNSLPGSLFLRGEYTVRTFLRNGLNLDLDTFVEVAKQKIKDFKINPYGKLSNG
nr:p23 protein [Thesium chinense closterovirus 1]